MTSRAQGGHYLEVSTPRRENHDELQLVLHSRGDREQEPLARGRSHAAHGDPLPSGGRPAHYKRKQYAWPVSPLLPSLISCHNNMLPHVRVGFPDGGAVVTTRQRQEWCSSTGSTCCRVSDSSAGGWWPQLVFSCQGRWRRLPRNVGTSLKSARLC